MTHTELLNAQMNAEKTNKELKESYDNIVHYEKIENTPFTMGIYQRTYTVLFGNHRMTDVYGTWEQAIEELETRKWDITMNIVVICMEKLREDIKLNNI